MEDQILNNNEYCSQHQHVLNLIQSSNSIYLKQYLSNKNIASFFIGLQNHLKPSNLIMLKKHHQLTQGVYILIEGSIKGILTQSTHLSRELKDYIFFQIKTGNNTLNYKNKIPTNYKTFTIQKYDVFQCRNNNYITTDQCWLINIESDILRNCQYYRINEIKLQLVGKLSSDVEGVEQLMSHQLILKQYIFRFQFKHQYYSIISEGLIKSKPNQLSIENSNLLGTNSLLLPNISYQVISSTAKILILKNQNIAYCPKKNKKILTQFVSLPNKQPQPQYDNKQKKVRNRIKEVVRKCKQIQNFALISMYVCNRTYKFSKNTLHKSIQKHQTLQYPKLLFEPTLKSKKYQLKEKCTSNHNQNKIFQNSKFLQYTKLNIKPLSQKHKEIKSKILKNRQKSEISQKFRTNKKAKFNTILSLYDFNQKIL